MNDKPNYGKGYKHEVIELLYLTGIIPYSSLRLLSGETRMYQRSILEMKKSGVLAVDKKGGEKNIRLNERAKNKSQYEEYIKPEYIEYYEKEVLADIKHLGEKDKYIRNKKDYVRGQKEIRDSATKVMMYVTGYEIGPGKPHLRENVMPLGYYTSSEFKESAGYGPSVETAEGTKKLSNTRITGMLATKGGVYAIYNISSKMIEWKRKGELKIANCIMMYDSRRTQSMKTARKEAIIIAKNNSQYIRIMENANYKTDNKITIINIDFTYNGFYAVPEDKNGILLLKIMGIENWKAKIINSILTPEEREASQHTNVDCHGYDEKNDIYKLVFCIPDLGKLKQFTKRAVLENDRKKFKIYCYSYQTEMIKEYARGKVRIAEIPIEKFIKQYFKEIPL